MGLIPTLVSFSAGTLIKAADFNTNFSAITTAFNNTAVLTDVAKTITVAHTFAADVLFADGLYDIGKTGATRPRDGFFSRNLTVGGTLRSSTQVLGDANAAKELFLQPGDPAGRVVFRSSASVELSAIRNDGIWLHGGPASAGSASAGEFVFANNKAIRASNVLGTDSIAIIKLNSGNVIHVAPVAGAVAVGPSVADASLNAGEIGLANAKYYHGTNAAASLTRALIGLDATDYLRIGPAGLNVILLGNPTTGTSAASGEVVLANAKAIRWANSAGSNTVDGIKVDVNGVVILSPASILVVGAPVSTASALQGEVVLATAKALRSSNNGGSGTFSLIASDSGDRVALSPDGQDIKWGKPTVALGAGATPTLGTIGGSGPAGAAQTSWLRVVDSGGTARFIPLWT